MDWWLLPNLSSLRLEIASEAMKCEWACRIPHRDTLVCQCEAMFPDGGPVRWTGHEPMTGSPQNGKNGHQLRRQVWGSRACRKIQKGKATTPALRGWCSHRVAWAARLWRVSVKRDAGCVAGVAVRSWWGFGFGSQPAEEQRKVPCGLTADGSLKPKTKGTTSSSRLQRIVFVIRRPKYSITSLYLRNPGCPSVGHLEQPLGCLGAKRPSRFIAGTRHILSDQERDILVFPAVLKQQEQPPEIWP